MKIIYFIVGLLMMIIGSIGVVLPVLPTTPFFLGAIFFFGKSSQRVHDMFVESKLYKDHFSDFVKSRSMTLKSKIKLLSLASFMMLLAFISVQNIHVRILIIVLVIFKYYYFTFKIKTIKESL
ncbi:MAG: YbaN family protein [Anaerorhabdus sp.]